MGKKLKNKKLILFKWFCPDRQMRNVAKFDPKRPSLVHLHISWDLNAACLPACVWCVFALAVLSHTHSKSDWQQINQDLAESLQSKAWAKAASGIRQQASAIMKSKPFIQALSVKPRRRTKITQWANHKIKNKSNKKNIKMIDVCNLAHLCKMWRRKTLSARCDTKELSARAHFKFVTENVTKIFHMRKARKKTQQQTTNKRNETTAQRDDCENVRSTANFDTHFAHTHTPSQAKKNLRSCLWMDLLLERHPTRPRLPHTSSYIKCFSEVPKTMPA